MPGFRPGRLGFETRLPLEKGAAWRLPRSLRCGELLAKLFVRRRQTLDLVLQALDLGDQIVVFTGSVVFVRTHGRSIRICPANRNATAEVANQLLQIKASAPVVYATRLQRQGSSVPCVQGTYIPPTQVQTNLTASLGIMQYRAVAQQHLLRVLLLKMPPLGG